MLGQYDMIWWKEIILLPVDDTSIAWRMSVIALYLLQLPFL